MGSLPIQVHGLSNSFKTICLVCVISQGTNKSSSSDYLRNNCMNEILELNLPKLNYLFKVQMIFKYMSYMGCLLHSNS